MKTGIKTQEWDGVTPLYGGGDHYIFDADQLEEYIEGCGLPRDEMRLYICAPNYAQELDTGHFEMDMNHDDEVPDELMAAVNAFNDAVKAYGKPLSWSPTGTVAIITAK